MYLGTSPSTLHAVWLKAALNSVVIHVPDNYSVLCLRYKGLCQAWADSNCNALEGRYQKAVHWGADFIPRVIPCPPLALPWKTHSLFLQRHESKVNIYCPLKMKWSSIKSPGSLNWCLIRRNSKILIMFFRTSLAVLHWNANAGRAQAETRDGKKRFSVSFPKANAGQPSVRKIKTKTSYGRCTKMAEVFICAFMYSVLVFSSFTFLLTAYGHSLIQTLFVAVETDRTVFSKYREEQQPSPRPLAQEYEQANKAEVLAGYRTRFRDEEDQE